MNGRRAAGRGRTALLAAAIWLLQGAASPAGAFIPEADRTMQAIAEVNRASRRSQALQLEVTMRIGERGLVARGELISHPSGLARLELRRANGRVVRYLLSGRELLGAEDGRPLDRPRPLLQPLFFLQPASRVTLRAALESFGVSSDAIGLATCGDADCFVIGDPRLAAPWPPAEESAGAADGLDDPLADPMGGLGVSSDPAGQEVLTGPSLVALESDRAGRGPRGDSLLPRLWVDTRDLQVRRIDRASGVFTIFGPIVSFDRVMVPAWFEIHEPGMEPIRFEVDRALQVNAPPQAFSRKWLLTRPEPPSGSEPAAPSGVPTPASAGEDFEAGTPAWAPTR